MCATLLNPNQPNQCITASPVRARERQIRAPKRGILWVRCRCSYWDNVTVYPYNGCIRDTNPVVRHVMSLTCTLRRMRANQSAAKTCRNTTFTWLNCASPSTKSRDIIGARCRGSYWDNITVYPYDGYITGTNPIVRRVISLTWTLPRMCANQPAPKHNNTTSTTSGLGNSYSDNVAVYPCS